MNIDKTIISHKPTSHGGIFSISNPKPDLIDFSSNVNPLKISTKLKHHIINNLGIISQYPDSNSTILKDTLQKYIKIPSNQFIIGNGATEIIYNFCYCFLKNNTQVLIQSPTFAEYESAANLRGCKIIHFKTMNLNNNLEKFLQKIPNNGCVFLCNPNNPTGELLTKSKIKKILQMAKKSKSFVFVDESFIELVPDSNQSVISFLKQFDNLFILRSMTKSFGLAGLRIGYGVGSKTLISILNKTKLPWNVNGFVQLLAKFTLENTNLSNTRRLIKKESTYLRKSISQIAGFKCHETSTNFILLKTKKTSKTLQQKLLKKKILVRNCENFHGLDNHYIRIAVKTHKENKKLVEALKEL